MLQPDGKILAAGTYDDVVSGRGFLLARFETDGRLDSSFGDGGWGIIRFGDDTIAYPESMELRKDGKITLAGYLVDNGSRQEGVLARCNPDGSLDEGFGSGGKVISNFGAGHEFINHMVLQRNGKIVVAGHAQFNDGITDFLLARYRSDGVLDETFGGGDGWITGNFYRAATYLTGLAVQGDGNILAFGSILNIEGSGYFITRYHGDPLTESSSLGDWRQSHFGSPENTGEGADAADPDGDGLPNLLEWAAGSDPKAFTAPFGTLSRGVVDGTLEFSCTRSFHAVQAGAVFTVEWADDPSAGPWSASGVTETVVSEENAIQRVKALVPAGEAGRRFVRLRVTAP